MNFLERLRSALEQIYYNHPTPVMVVAFTLATSFLALGIGALYLKLGKNDTGYSKVPRVVKANSAQETHLGFRFSRIVGQSFIPISRAAWRYMGTITTGLIIGALYNYVISSPISIGAIEKYYEKFFRNKNDLWAENSQEYSSDPAFIEHNSQIIKVIPQTVKYVTNKTVDMSVRRVAENNDAITPFLKLPDLGYEIDYDNFVDTPEILQIELPKIEFARVSLVQFLRILFSSYLQSLFSAIGGGWLMSGLLSLLKFAAFRSVIRNVLSLESETTRVIENYFWPDSKNRNSNKDYYTLRKIVSKVFFWTALLGGLTIPTISPIPWLQLTYPIAVSLGQALSYFGLVQNVSQRIAGALHGNMEQLLLPALTIGNPELLLGIYSASVELLTSRLTLPIYLQGPFGNYVRLVTQITRTCKSYLGTNFVINENFVLDEAWISQFSPQKMDAIDSIIRISPGISSRIPQFTNEPLFYYSAFTAGSTLLLIILYRIFHWYCDVDNLYHFEVSSITNAKKRFGAAKGDNDIDFLGTPQFLKSLPSRYLAQLEIPKIGYQKETLTHLVTMSLQIWLVLAFVYHNPLLLYDLSTYADKGTLISECYKANALTLENIDNLVTPISSGDGASLMMAAVVSREELIALVNRFSIPESIARFSTRTENIFSLFDRFSGLFSVLNLPWMPRISYDYGAVALPQTFVQQVFYQTSIFGLGSASALLVRTNLLVPLWTAITGITAYFNIFQRPNLQVELTNSNQKSTVQNKTIYSRLSKSCSNMRKFCSNHSNIFCWWYQHL